MTVPHALPRLALIADRFTDAEQGARTVEAVAAGVRWVHLRDHAAPASRFSASAVALVDRLRAVRPDVRISVNTRAAIAGPLGLGVHVGRRGPAPEAARRRYGADVLIGYSAHTAEAGVRAAEAGADYLFFSPVFETPSKPGRAGAGLDALAVCCRAAPCPVFALGGVTPEQVRRCLDAGAYGVAVLSGILAARDPAGAARRNLGAFTVLQPHPNRSDSS